MRKIFRLLRASISAVMAITLWLGLGTMQPAFAQQPSEPLVKAELISGAEEIKSGEPFWLGVKLDIQKDWHVYWQNPGDSGIPTTVSWQAQQGVTFSPIHWPLPERQPYSGLVNYGYSDRVVLPVAVTVEHARAALTLNAKVAWLACRDICIPESADLSITVPVSGGSIDNSGFLESALNQVPKPVSELLKYEIVGDQAHIFIPQNAIPEGAKIGQFFPIEDGIIQNAAPQEFTENNGAYRLKTAAGGLHENVGTIKAVLSFSHEGEKFALQFGVNNVPNNGELSEAYAPATSGGTVAKKLPSQEIDVPVSVSFVVAIGLAFLGGLLLNLMPCVLPIVALKAFSITKKNSAANREAAMEGIAYTSGVLGTMALLGIALFALKSAGESVGWGFQLQSPAMVVALLLLMLLVGMFLLGWFQLPNLFTSADQKLGGKQGATGSFFTGALSVAVATPCTAPFMAPALGAAAALPFVEGILILLSLGLGLAFPYLLISVWPPARAILPKPGAWMETFKQALAFPMFATAAWLLWVLVQLNGALGLGYALIGIVLLGFAIWLHAHVRPGFWRKLALLIALFAVVTAVRSQPDSGLSAASSHAVMPGSVGEVAYDAVTLQTLRNQGKPVLVDATAAWCITCKINEQVALRDADVRQFFETHNITLMVADWTMRDATITEYLAQFGRNGVPLYVWYAPGKAPKVLPQILTPSIVLDALKPER